MRGQTVAIMTYVGVCGTPSAATMCALTVLSPCRIEFRKEE
jgi:L-cystine uptake protein TcyP (sodium:dicarboxylate symporter family)